MAAIIVAGNTSGSITLQAPDTLANVVLSALL